MVKTSLTAKQIERIRFADATMESLAKKYRVSIGTIYKIKNDVAPYARQSMNQVDR